MDEGHFLILREVGVCVIVRVCGCVDAGVKHVPTHTPQPLRALDRGFQR